jgi:CRP/FNR family transcriptional regulator
MVRDLNCKYCDIRNVTCFTRLTEEDLAELNESKVSTVYKKNQIIFQEGMLPTGLYCLSKGKIKISKTGPDGKDQIVRFVTEGGLLGVRALLSGRKYSATAATLEETIVCYINKQTFLKFVLKYPDISNCMIVLLSTLLEEAENKITSMAQKPVRERLAESLVILNSIFEHDTAEGHASDNETAITLTREDLANIVGTATETVIRLLSEFREEELIFIQGRSIALRDIEGLRKIGNVNY